MTLRAGTWFGIVLSLIVALSAKTARAEDAHQEGASQPLTVELADEPAHDDTTAKTQPTTHEAAPAAPHATENHVTPAPLDDDSLEPAVEDVSDLEIEGAPAKNPKAYGELIRHHTRSIRDKVLDKIDAKIEAKQEKTMDRVSGAIAGFGWLGVFLLLTPLYFRKKYPGRDVELFKHAAISSVMFVVTVNLLGAVLMFLRGAQGVANQYVNPQAAVVEATFDVLDKRADELAALGPQVLGPMLGAFAQGSDESPFVVLFQNAARMKEDAQIFTKIASMYKSVDWLMEIVPVVMTLLAVFAFAKSARGTLTQIVRLPELAIQGGPGVAMRVVKETAKRVGNELLATLALIGMLVVVTITGGLVLKQAIEPAVEALLGFAFTNIVYVTSAKDASLFMVVVSLALAAGFLALNIAAVVVPSGMFLGKFHKIMQRRVHDKVPVLAHAKFLMFGPLVLLACFVFPVLFILAGEPICEWMIDRSLASPEPSYGLLLIGAPAALVIGFVIGFVVMCGFGLRFVMKYKPDNVGTPVVRIQTMVIPQSHGPSVPAYVPYAAARPPSPFASFAPLGPQVAQALQMPQLPNGPMTLPLPQIAQQPIATYRAAPTPQPFKPSSPDRTMPLAAMSRERANELLPSSPPPPLPPTASAKPMLATLISAGGDVSAISTRAPLSSDASPQPKAPLAPRMSALPPPPPLPSALRPSYASIPPSSDLNATSPGEMSASAGGGGSSSLSPPKKPSRPSLPIPLPPPGSRQLPKTLPPPATRASRGPFSLSALKPEDAAEVLARDLKSDAPPAAPPSAPDTSPEVPTMVEDDSPTELMAFSDLVKPPSGNN